MPLAVLADPVHSRDIAQVFDGPRRQQAVPVLAAGGRPVGGVEQQIGATRVAAPDREAQVIADQRADTPALELEHDLLVSGLEMLVLAGHAEQVALVVMRQRTIRTRPEQAIAIAAVVGLDDQAAADHRIETLRLLAQPCAAGTILRFGQRCRLHREAGGEHLRQDHQIGAARLLQQGLKVLAVGGRIVPGQGGLDQRQFEIGFVGHIRASGKSVARRADVAFHTHPALQDHASR